MEILSFMILPRGEEFMMATIKSKSIPAMFQASKRLRSASAVPISATDSIAEHCEGSPSMANLSRLTKKVSTVANASGASDLYPLPGFEPPLLARVGQLHKEEKKAPSALQVEGGEGETISGQEKVVELSNEQKMRMELNQAVARARRNLRVCAGQGKTFADLQHLLVEKGWLDVLHDEFSKQYFSKLQAFVNQEAAGKLPIYPPPALIFNAFNTCPFDKVKVVIIGQDPYHGPGQAMGLSFSVPQGIKVPSSLVNIFKEILDDVGCKIPCHGNLEKWAHQGVLLLNAVLTVREHSANSHSKKGWESFTDAAIRAVSQQKKGIIFLLWGNSAQEKIRLIDIREHHILKAAHPSGLSAHKGFFNCRHFSKTNQILEKAGKFPIDWQL